MPACGNCKHETSESANYCENCGAKQVPQGNDDGWPSLCRTLRACATRTFERLAYEHYHTPRRFVPREESFTSWNLQDIQRRHGDRVTVVPFSTHEETANGADWEWWFHADGEGFGMRVQAKRAGSGGNYPLQHRTRSGALQSDLLVTDALANNCIPAYVLYNHQNWVPRFPGGAPVPCVHGPGLTSHLGCTIVSALTVHAAVRRHGPGASRHARHASMPWNWVLCDSRRPTWQPALDAAFNEVQDLHNRGLEALKDAIRWEEESARYQEAFSETIPVHSAEAESRTQPEQAERRKAPVDVPAGLEQAALLSVRSRSDEVATRSPEELAAIQAQVQSVLGTAPYRGAEELANLSLGRLPDRVLDMVKYQDIAPGPDERVAGAVLLDLSPNTGGA